MSDDADITFERVTAIGPPPNDDGEPKRAGSIIEAVRHEIDYAKGRHDAYVEILGMLEAEQNDDSDA